MKLKNMDFMRKFQFPLMLACASMPVPVMLLANMAPQALTHCFILPAAYVLMAWVCILVPGKLRLAVGCVGCAALMLVGAACLPLKESALITVLPVGYAALLFYSLQFGAWTRDTEMAFGAYVAGVLLHALAQLLVQASYRTGEAQYAPAEGVLLGSFLVFLLLMLISLNRSSMNCASMGRQRIPARMRRRNQVLTLAFFALVLFVAAMPRIAALIEAGWNGVLGAVAALVQFLFSLFPAQEKIESTVLDGGNTGMESLGAMEEPGLLAQIVEKIAMALGALIGVALLVLAIWFLLRQLRKLLRWIWAMLSRFASAVSEDFEDEITDTREGGHVRRSPALAGLWKHLPLADETRMTPTQKIRYRYRRLLRRHPDWHEGRTARENLPQAAAQLYEQARYSGRTLDAQAAERFCEEIRDL